MKKRILILVALTALLSLAAAPVHAMPPIPVEGTFDYTFEVLETREAHGVTFIYAREWETWVGDFEGNGLAYFIVTQFPSGSMNVWLRTTITGTVLGDKEGTMVLRLVGKKPAGGEWYGHWVILRGTGDLASLRGQGTWWGPGYEGPDIPGERPDIYYEGKIRFRKTHFGPPW